MPKRLVVDLPQDPFTDRPRRKRPRTFFVGAQTWRYDHTTSRPRPQTTFLDLPLELRDLIYHDALEDFTATLIHPYDPLPKHARFKTYYNLRLANRQVGAEVKNIFRKHYESQMIFFFDNPPDLWDLWCQVEEHPRLRKAKFYLRCINDEEGYSERQEDANFLRYDSERLIRQQQVVRNVTEEVPSMYDHLGGPNWDPDYGGFEVRKRSKCSCTHSTLCPEYDEIIWPPIHRSSCSLRVRTYLWKSVFQNHKRPWRSRVYSVGSWVLEGEICDVGWEHYDLDMGRSRVTFHGRPLKPPVPRQVTILRAAGRAEELMDDLLSSEHSSTDDSDSDSSDSDSPESDDSENEDSDDSSSSSEDDFAPVNQCDCGTCFRVSMYNFSRENLVPGDAETSESDDSESSSEDDSSEESDDEGEHQSSNGSDSSSDTESSDDSDSTEW